MKIDPVAVVRSIRQALERVPGDSVLLTRAEFDALAAVVERPAQPKPQPPEQIVMALGLPAGLTQDQMAKLLERPKTVTQLAREAKVSTGTIKRALRAMPGVEVIREKVRAHKPGRRPYVYALH